MGPFCAAEPAAAGRLRPPAAMQEPPQSRAGPTCHPNAAIQTLARIARAARHGPCAHRGGPRTLAFASPSAARIPQRPSAARIPQRTHTNAPCAAAGRQDSTASLRARITIAGNDRTKVGRFHHRPRDLPALTASVRPRPSHPAARTCSALAGGGGGSQRHGAVLCAGRPGPVRWDPTPPAPGPPGHTGRFQETARSGPAGPRGAAAACRGGDREPPTLERRRATARTGRATRRPPRGRAACQQPPAHNSHPAARA